MMTDLFKWKGPVGSTLRAVAMGLVLGASSVLLAQQSPTKEVSTPGFWHWRDPRQASFFRIGDAPCIAGPTAISDRLIYLSRAFGMQGLVAGSDHDSQMGLITDLAEQFHTDPSIRRDQPGSDRHRPLPQLCRRQRICVQPSGGHDLAWSEQREPEMQTGRETESFLDARGREQQRYGRGVQLRLLPSGRKTAISGMAALGWRWSGPRPIPLGSSCVSRLCRAMISPRRLPWC